MRILTSSTNELIINSKLSQNGLKHKIVDKKNNEHDISSIDGISTRKIIEQKAKELEEIFIADSLKHAKIGMPENEFGIDNKITDTFSSFMNKALAEIIVKQGGFGLTNHITESLIQSNSDVKSSNT
jgi:Rod binding domain-containing protein